MGLTSLPILNKLGHNSYWQNLFYTDKFSSIYINQFILVETLLKRLSEERFFYTFFNPMDEIKKKYMWDHFLKYPSKTVNTFTGEVWFLLYSSSLVISPLFFNSNMLNERKIRLKVNSTSLSLFYLKYYDQL